METTGDARTAATEALNRLMLTNLAHDLGRLVKHLTVMAEGLNGSGGQPNTAMPDLLPRCRDCRYWASVRPESGRCQNYGTSVGDCGPTFGCTCWVTIQRAEEGGQNA